MKLIEHAKSLGVERVFTFAAMATQPDLTQDIEMTMRQQQQDAFTSSNFQGTFRQLDDGEMIVADDEEGETL